MGLLSSIGKAVGAVTGLLGDGGTSALIGGGLGLLGGMNDNAASAQAASAANAQTEHMYKNRYQWQVQDMRAAGLNPILAAMNGAPSAGSGAMANTFSAADRAINGASAAANIRLANENIQNVKAQTAAANAQTAKTAAETIKLGRDEPWGKFVKQAGNNILKLLDNLPNIPDTINSAWQSYKENKSPVSKYSAPGPLRITVRPSDARSKEPEYLDQRTMRNLNSGVLYKN